MALPDNATRNVETNIITGRGNTPVETKDSGYQIWLFNGLN